MKKERHTREKLKRQIHGLGKPKYLQILILKSFICKGDCQLGAKFDGLLLHRVPANMIAEVEKKHTEIARENGLICVKPQIIITYETAYIMAEMLEKKSLVEKI